MGRANLNADDLSLILHYRMRAIKISSADRAKDDDKPFTNGQHLHLFFHAIFLIEYILITPQRAGCFRILPL